MKIHHFLIVLVAAVFSSKSKANQVLKPNQYSIIPQPSKILFLKGHFKISSRTKVIGKKNLANTGGYLSNRLKELIGSNIPFITEDSQSDINSIRLLIDSSISNYEGYHLTIKKNGIVISGRTQNGIFYGIQTLMQLFPVKNLDVHAKHRKIEVPYVEIKDEPRFKWRGMSLDIARHFIEVDEIEKLIRAMAMHKLNRLHLHLSDNSGWRLEIKGYPNLNTIGSIGNNPDPKAPSKFITEQQARDLTAYAAKYFIEIVPEVDIPGHSAAIVRAYPQLGGGNNTINVMAPETEKFVDTIVERVTTIFNSKYFHFGGDEVGETNWTNFPCVKDKMAELGLKNTRELEAWFDQKTAQYILDQNIQPIAWDEAADFNINKHTIIQWWRGLHPEQLTKALEAGHQVIISPADHVYFDYPYNTKEYGAHWEGMRNGGNSTELVYNWEPIPLELNTSLKSQVLGIEFCVWTEFIKSERRLEYMIFPRISAFSEVAWDAEGSKNLQQFKRKLNTQIQRYQLEGLNYRKINIPDKDRQKIQSEGFMDY